MHSVFFLSSTRAADDSHLLDRILMSFFNIHNSCDIEVFKSQLAAFIIPRRQGKTYVTVIIMAAALLCIKNITLAYVAHIRFQSNSVMRQLKNHLQEMLTIISEQESSFKNKFCPIEAILEHQALGTLTVNFTDSSTTFAKVTSCNNKNVSIYFNSHITFLVDIRITLQYIFPK